MRKSYHTFAAFGMNLQALSVIFSLLMVLNLPAIGELPQSHRQQVILKDAWRGFSWTSDYRQTHTHDSNGKCIGILHERWNGLRWKKDRLERFLYDDLHYQTAGLIYRWDKTGNWKLIGGANARIDTTNASGNRVVLYNAQWDPMRSFWVAGDSVIYDKRGRVVKMTNRSYDVSNSGRDSVLIIKTIENTWQGKTNWVEDTYTKRSDSKQTTLERCRYRQVGDSIMQTFTIDYWDSSIKGWLSNTAMLFSMKDSAGLAYDSIVELINKRPVPVYVESELRDNSGNTLRHRVMYKSYDKKGEPVSGSFYKWERGHLCQNQFTIAESTFTYDGSTGRWELLYYENQRCNISTDKKATEWGYFAESEEWEQVRSFDTLTSCGIKIKAEQYYDKEKKRWLPLVHFRERGDSDSTIITTEIMDLETGDWIYDSMYVVQLNDKGKIEKRTNYVWKRTALNGNWSKDSRMTYLDAGQ
ncbi:MAG: hypothetical protein ACOC41_00020 [Chitinivibrionales bacterium]